MKLKLLAAASLFAACQLSAASAAGLSNAVAVLDFVPENVVPGTADRTVGLADDVEVALQKQGVPVLERRNLRLVLAERDLHAGGLLSAESLSQAKLPMVEYFVGGSAAFPGAGEFTLTLSIIRADQATLESTFTRHGTYPEEWLPAIESVAQEVNQRLKLPKPASAERSEFEMMTWLPEAALPFFKGLDYYGRGDYALAVPWFRHSYEEDKHFNLARDWEARAYGKLNLSVLAEALSQTGTNNRRIPANLKRPVAAVVAGGNLSAAGRAAFVQALARAGRFELFDPASIGATAREIDLQLTGQMAAPLNERSVWLVVDDLIYLAAPDDHTLVACRQNLLSGEVSQRVKITAADHAEAGCAALAKAFLENNKPTLEPSKPENASLLPEPTRQDPPEVAFAKALRLAAANPQSARLWIGLADFYPAETAKILLERAVSAIATNRQSPDAAFWLASALWRERELSRRNFYIPTATRLAPHPLTNDFERLIRWFPDSHEANHLTEVTNHGEGSYVYVTLADRRYLGAVFTNNAVHSPAAVPFIKPPPAPAVTDEQRLSRLNEYLKQNRPAPAWQLVNVLRAPDGSFAQPQVQTNYDELLQVIARENQQFKEFTAAVGAKQSQHALELGRALLNCVDRRDRAEVIRTCGGLIRDAQGVPAQLKFVFAAARQYRDDFLIDPATGGPADSVEFQVMANTASVTKVIGGPDTQYERMIGEVAEAAHDLAPPGLAVSICEDIRNDKALPPEQRLTAAYDLALLELAQGRNFEALELLKDILRQTEGTGLPLKRNDIWSQSLESAAFEALRKVRIFAGAGGDLCDCCGKVPAAPPQKPANFEEMDRLLGQLWKQEIGEAGTNHPPIQQQLLARKAEFFPAILYQLRMDQEVSHLLLFCRDLGTNALPALPVIAQIIHRGEPFQDYNNALLALGSLGRAAGCAKPLLILSRENANNGNFNHALKKIGPAPRRVLPLLAQLLYHTNPEISKMAARAVIETAGLDKSRFPPKSDEQLIQSVREWWESDGCKQEWESNPQPLPNLENQDI